MAVEDFSAYTEVDPDSEVTRTATRVTWTQVARNTDTYVYDDKDAAHFNGDFEQLLTLLLAETGSSLSSVGPFWALTNQVDDLYNIDIESDSALWGYVRMENSTERRFVLCETDGGTLYQDLWAGAAWDTPYYLKIKRDEAVGTYGTLYCYIYSDSARTNLLDTLQHTLHTSKKDFQYVFGMSTYNNADAATTSGYVENLDLQEATGGWTTIAKVNGVGQAAILKVGGVAKADIAKIMGTAV